VVTFWTFAFAALFWAVVQPWWSFDPSVLAHRASLLGAFDGVQVPVWLALTWVVVLGTLAPYALHIAALRHLPPTTAGVVGMAEPVLAAAVAWSWLGQVLDPVQVVGGALVLVGVGLAQLAQARASRAGPSGRPARAGPAAPTDLPAAAVSRAA
jgi:drug/metabolite transporter (DMT)-like permease